MCPAAVRWFCPARAGLITQPHAKCLVMYTLSNTLKCHRLMWTFCARTGLARSDARNSGYLNQMSIWLWFTCAVQSRPIMWLTLGILLVAAVGKNVLSDDSKYAGKDEFIGGMRVGVLASICGAVRVDDVLQVVISCWFKDPSRQPWITLHQLLHYPLLGI